MNAKGYNTGVAWQKCFKGILFIVGGGVAKTQKFNSLFCIKMKPQTQPSRAC